MPFCPRLQNYLIQLLGWPLKVLLQKLCRINEVQLNALCDDSEKAYAASLYIRICITPGEYVTNLLTARTKVAPIEVESLPRLEFCAATLMAKMVETLRVELILPTIETYY